MVSIMINGIRAVPDSSSSFEFIVENSLFSDSQSYTLTISFPMRGCQENQRVFGHINRDDVAKGSALMGCEIFAQQRFWRGSLALIEVSADAVKGQFLEGVNPDDGDSSIDSLYVNALDLGSFPFTKPSEISPESARNGTQDEVCLPWIPEGYDVVNCLADSPTKWNEECRSLAWQPSLLSIVERIAGAAGYSCDISSLKNSHWKDAIICNTLPPTWGVKDYAAALPAWTVREFFEKLSLFLKGSFIFDESEKSVTFRFRDELRSEAGVVDLDMIVDGYSAAVSRDEEDADFLPLRRLRYKKSDNILWKYLDAPWLLRSNWKIDSSHDTVEKLEKGGFTYDNDGHRLSGGGPVFYCREIDTYFVSRPVMIYSKGHTDKSLSDRFPYAKFVEMQPVNVFGPQFYEADDDIQYEDLEFVPVVVDYALEGKMMWLPVGSFESDGNSVYDPLDTGVFDEYDGGSKSHRLSNGVVLSENLVLSKTRITHAIESHSDDDKENTFFDRVYVGFRNPRPMEMPYPLTDVDVFAGKVMSRDRYMRLDGGGAGEAIDPKVKYSFTFCSGSIPDVNALFSIHGQLYICRKITATFTSRGMSKLLKGEFYRLLRD